MEKSNATIQPFTYPTRFGKIESIACMFDIMYRQLDIIAHSLFPGDDQYLVRNECRARMEGEFLAVFARYSAWSRPINWMLDFASDETGEFGILLTGAYTCLVQVRKDGSVSGHS